MDTKKELVKTFNALVKDIMDNYEKYSDIEKMQIRDLLDQFKNLNLTLDKYDSPKTADLFTKYVNAFKDFFGKIKTKLKK
jgi:hypothetical protein